MNRIRSLLIPCLAFFFSTYSCVFGSTASSVIIQPLRVAAPDGIDPYAPYLENIINQSGLSAPYISGVTDFALFTESVTADLTGSADDVASGTIGPPAVLNFDLGSIYRVNGLAIWNNLGSSSLIEFDVFTSHQGTFSTKQYLGSFRIEDAISSSAEYAQVISFAETSGRFYQISATANNGFDSATRINEIAFRAVPEPTTLTLLFIISAITLFCCLSRKWRKRYSV